MRLLFTICGRTGSKGIKNKNIRDFVDYPLSFYSLSAIDLFLKRNSAYEADIVVNTDSIELIHLFESNKVRKVDIIHRSHSLGLDDTPKISVIKNCLDTMSQNNQCKYDMVIDLDITSPLRTVNDIENLINEKINHNYDIVFSVTESRRNPYFNMVTKINDNYTRVINSNFNTRQEAPEIYDMNASLYAYSPDFLDKNKDFFEGKCGIIKMYDTGILDLDHENDFELMEVIAEYLFQNNEEMNEVRENIFN